MPTSLSTLLLEVLIIIISCLHLDNFISLRDSRAELFNNLTGHTASHVFVKVIASQHAFSLAMTTNTRAHQLFDRISMGLRHQNEIYVGEAVLCGPPWIWRRLLLS